MEKTIKIGNKKIVIKASAAVLIYYKEQFGTEYMEDREKLKSEEQDEEFAVLMGGQLIWAMAKAANDKILPPEEFYEDIGSFDLDLAMIEAAELFDKSCQNINNDSTGERSELTSESIVSTALLCKMSLDDLNKLSLSMALNVINEYCRIKSGEEGYKQATQEDFDNL